MIRHVWAPQRMDWLFWRFTNYVLNPMLRPFDRAFRPMGTNLWVVGEGYFHWVKRSDYKWPKQWGG